MESTAEYFKVEALNQFETIGVLDYMQYADMNMERELARGAKYFEKTAKSLDLLRAGLIRHLIERFMDQMVAECTREFSFSLKSEG